MEAPLDQTRTHEPLAAVGEQLAARGAHAELVVIGGSALLALGLISRPTRDVDVVALLAGGTLVDPRPLTAELIAARNRVARDFGLPENRLNPAPADLLDFGLPEGFVERLERHDYGGFPSPSTSRVASTRSTSSSTRWTRGGQT